MHGELYVSFSVELLQLFARSTRPRELTSVQVEQRDAHCEGIGLQGVQALDQGLGGHVEWTPDFELLFHDRLPLVDEPGEPEVSYFPLPLAQEDIGRLDVPVDDQVLAQVLAALEDGIEYLPEGLLPFELVGIIPSLLFLFAQVGLQELLQVAALAEVRHDVAVVLGVVDVMEFQQVRVVELLQDLDLILEQRVVGLVDAVQVDHLHREHLAVLVLVVAAVHLAAVPAADGVIQVEVIVPDFFLGILHHVRVERAVPAIALLLGVGLAGAPVLTVRSDHLNSQ